MGLKVAELETLFTANLDDFAAGAAKVETTQKKLDGSTAKTTVTSDTKAALAAMDLVESTGKTLDKKVYTPTVAAEISQTKKDIDAVKQKLLDLQAKPTSLEVRNNIRDTQVELTTLRTKLLDLEGQSVKVDVEADTSKADQKLAKVKSDSQSLPEAKLPVDADTSKAGEKVKELGSKISEMGNESGGELAGGIVAALATIPFAGAVIGVGVAIGKTIMSGLQNEVRSDRLMAQTGLDPETVGRLGRAAGEAYANNYGESIAANFDAAKIAVQTRILDPSSTTRDAQTVIQNLSGVADLVGEEVSRVARSTTQLIQTGMVPNAQAAFDVIVKGQQAGLNVSEDWLDTINEYSTQWRKLGITGPQAVGLLSQAVKAGARDTDIAADALKEFSIRAVDGSTTTAAGFKLIGLNAKEMAETIGKGGPDAAAALELTLNKLRDIKDPALQAQAAVDLFGTQAEDMGKALYAMDLSNAVTQLGSVQGAAKSALDTISGNAANDIESAKRNIEVAADGIKGALAAAFNPQIEGFATYVSENREAVIDFLLNIANGGINAGIGIVNGLAAGTEAIGNFISGPIADMLEATGAVAVGIDKMLPGDQHGKEFQESMKETAESLRKVKGVTSEMADNMRTNLIDNALVPARDKLQELAIPLKTQAAVHDAATKMAADLDGVGYAADGSAMNLSGFTDQLDTTTSTGSRLYDQLKNVVSGLQETTDKAALAGESNEELTSRINDTRDALLNQLTQMGMTKDEAQALIDKYGLIPDKIMTTAQLDTIGAQTTFDNFITSNTGKKLWLSVGASGQVNYRVDGTSLRFYHDGGIALPMADGGVLDSSVASMVPPGTPRIVGDRLDVPEAFIPLDGSARSRAILAQTIARMPGALMADGGIVGSQGGDTIYVSLQVDVSKIQSVAQLERFVKMLPQLARQKAGVHGG